MQWDFFIKQSRKLYAPDVVTLLDNTAGK